MEYLFPYPKMGTSFLEILHDPLTRKLLGFDATHAERISFTSGVSSRLTFLLNDATKHLSFLKIGYTALEAFLQANCTGPPLDFNPEDSIFPELYKDDSLPALKQELLQSLSVDGTAVYSLTPHIELFWLANLVLCSSVLADAGFNGRRARFRVTVWHQKLLTEKSHTLQTLIYQDADVLEQQLSSRLVFGGAAAEEHFVEFLVERAQIRIFFGDDDKAREDLARAAKTRQFYFALTGALGKRTKYQVNDLSQLVVLAKSRDFEPEPYSSRKSSRVEEMDSRKGSRSDIQPLSRTPTTSIEPPRSPSQLARRPQTPTSPRATDYPTSPRSFTPLRPESVPLNDDTILEHIAFKELLPFEPNLTHVSDGSTLPDRLTDLDPSNQPLLFPMDSIILLATASSIQNTSPEDGLTREETLPYATRVLDGGSSNWQVYTQALLVRSRIEGYKSRTTERGLLQLQALVDQVITETTTTTTTLPPKPQDGATTLVSSAKEPTSAPSTFFPLPHSPSETATVGERLKYIYPLSPPLRWELEAELAARWTSLGGLKTALEIYRRLQMTAEVALCLAATNAEAEAVETLRKVLFVDAENKEEGEGIGSLKLQFHLPPDAPRLLCILGDIDLSSSPPPASAATATTTHPSVTQAQQYYNLSYTISNNTYPRAQRSLARLYTKQRDFPAAQTAYRLALRNAQLDHATWFALGCVQLELQEWTSAAESFRRVVSIEVGDSLAWSNLAVALLRLPVAVPVPVSGSAAGKGDDEAGESNTHRKAAGDAEEEEEDEDEHALLTDSDTPTPTHPTPPALTSSSPSPFKPPDPYANKRSALLALRYAATLKRDDARIWDNYLTVAASIPPAYGTPWTELIQAFTRVVELRAQKEGEGAIDLRVLRMLVEEVVRGYEYPGGEEGTVAGDGDGDGKGEPEDVPMQEQVNSLIVSGKDGTHAMPYLPRALLSLLSTHILPLASSPELYHILAKVALWRRRPAEALGYHEKAWRAATSAPDAYGSPENWEKVVRETQTLVTAYRELGGLERERVMISAVGDGADSQGGKSEFQTPTTGAACIATATATPAGQFDPLPSSVTLTNNENENHTPTPGNHSITPTQAQPEPETPTQPQPPSQAQTQTQRTLVEKSWRFKSRSAIRAVQGRGKDAGYDESAGMETLRVLLEDLN